jgi:DNA-binding NtrC family response regulator
MTSEIDVVGKTVFLVDSQHEPREARARRLRTYGILVYTASSIEEARVHFGVNRYHLVLLATRENPEAAIAFRREIRQQDPNQKVAFLVGPPDYLSFTFGRNLIPMPARSSDWADKFKGRLASA